MHKKTELFLEDCNAGVCVESDTDNDLIVFSLTEYDIDETKSTDNDVHLFPRSTTEIYIGEKETGAIIGALIETLGEEDI